MPRGVKTLVRPVVYSLLDSIDRLTGRIDPLVPPRRMIFIGSGDFRKVGDEFLQNFREIGLLQRDESVLDVGCGIGRMAVPLTRYLSARGHYEGFDIVASGITWCQEKITPAYPNFRFQLADVYNHMYHQEGKYKASEYRFPFEDASFDFVFLTSVFTHMFPHDMANYLKEIARVLKPGGRCLITYFLWNMEAQARTGSHSTDLNFQYVRDGYRIADEKEPEYAIAMPEEWLRERYSEYGLKIQEPIRYGSWSAGPHPTSYQDIVLGVKL